MPWTPQGPYSTGNNFTSGNANNIESGVSQTVWQDGTQPITGAQDFNRTLSGADKTFFTVTATDGKKYSLRERNSDKALLIHNDTDNVDLLVLGPGAGIIKMGTNTVFHAGNDGAGSGLDADTLQSHAPGAGNGLDADTTDGIHASGFQQFGTGGQKTGFKVTEGNALPVSGMSKGDIHFLTSFSLP